MLTYKRCVLEKKIQIKKIFKKLNINCTDQYKMESAPGHLKKYPLMDKLVRSKLVE